MGRGEESPENSSDIPRRGFLKGLGATAAASILAGGVDPAASEYTERVEGEIVDLMDTVTEYVTNYGFSARDRDRIYLDDLNEYDYRGFLEGGDAPATRAVVEDGEVSVDLVYLEEEIDEDEFQRRRKQEYRNYVENLDTYFGLSEEEQYKLLAAAEAAEVAAYPEEEFRDKLEYVLSRVAEELDDEYDQFTLNPEEVGEVLHVDEDAYKVDDRVLEELADHVQEVYQDVFAPYDISIDVNPRRITENDLEQYDYDIGDIIPLGGRRTARRLFREDFGYEDGNFPVLMSTRDMGPAFDGRGLAHQAFVHMPVDTLVHDGRLEDWMLGRMLKHYLVPHEVGHSMLRLPHNAYPADFMSYNKVPRSLMWLMGEGLELGEWNRQLTDRLITGDDVADETVKELIEEHVPIALTDVYDFDALTDVDEMNYLTGEEVFRMNWWYGEEEKTEDRTELDITLGDPFEQMTMRTYKDGEVVNKKQRTF